MSATDAEIDEIIDRVDALCWDNKWAEIDSILENHDVLRSDLSVSLSYLSMTLCVKSKLNKRRKFYGDVERKLRESYSTEETNSILKGLE